LNTTAPEIALHEAEREKRSIALTSLLAALLLVTLKTAVGLATQSLGVLSEAAHSGLDLVAAAITYLSVRVSDRPADAEHQYGHGKVENFSAFLETGLLLLACAWISWEAVRRLFFKDVHVEPSVWAFGVMAVSVVIDHFRGRALERVARKYQSQALEADALHFRTDVWSSSVVIVGLAGVWLADVYQWPWLRAADPVAALVVAGIVVWISVRLGKRTVDALLDAAPPGVRTHVEAAVAGVEGVLRVERVRTRQAGNRSFVDVTIAVRALPFERVHQISDQSKRRWRRRFHTPTSSCTWSRGRTRPRACSTSSRHRPAPQPVGSRAIRPPGAGRRREPDRLVLELDAEVDERLTLREAHALIDRVEREIQRELPEVADINTHIETLGHEIVPAAELEELARALEGFLRETPYHFPELLDCHEVHVRQVEGKIVASCHATLKADLPITRVHDITQELETDLPPFRSSPPDHHTDPD
jgi:cation diffusion facilitator family transporter